MVEKVILSVPTKSRARKTKRECGHWVKVRYKKFCETCYNRTSHRQAKRRELDRRYRQSPAGKAINHAYDTSAKGRLRSSRSYYKKRKQGMTAAEAKHEAVRGDTKETARRAELKRVRNRLGAQRHRNRWGNIKTNPVHRHRWEMIREGLWKEEGHPL